MPYSKIAGGSGLEPSDLARIQGGSFKASLHLPELVRLFFTP